MKKLHLGIAVVAALIGWLLVWGPLKGLTNLAVTTHSSQESKQDQVGSEPAASSTAERKNTQSAIAIVHGAAGSIQAQGAPTGSNAFVDARGAADRLPAESNFLHGKYVDGAATQGILQSNRFGDIMRELQKEAMHDSLAVDQTKTYQAAIQQEAAKVKSTVEIQDFACGLRICMGSMRSTDQAQFNNWMKEFLSSNSTPKYAVTSYTGDLGGGNYEHRFLFSTDPTSNGIAVPLPPPVH